MWIWKPYFRLSIDELHDLIQLRERVFIVEQNCAYLDVDGRDKNSWHLLGYEGDKLAVTLRVTLPGVRFPEYSIGRVASSPEFRRQGYGRRAVAEALKLMEDSFGKNAIRISAQSYLEKFYAEFGFETARGPYLEDDIPHFEMLRKPPA